MTDGLYIFSSSDAVTNDQTSTRWEVDSYEKKEERLGKSQNQIKNFEKKSWDVVNLLKTI